MCTLEAMREQEVVVEALMKLRAMVYHLELQGRESEAEETVEAVESTAAEGVVGKEVVGQEEVQRLAMVVEDSRSTVMRKQVEVVEVSLEVVRMAAVVLMEAAVVQSLVKAAASTGQTSRT